MKQSIVKEAKAYLKDRKGQWCSIAKATGVSQQWISKLMSGEIKEPGALKIESIIKHARKHYKKLAV